MSAPSPASTVAAASCGLFILDVFEWRGLDGTLKKREESVIGGGGTYAIVGSRMWLPAEKLGIVVDRGNDWPLEVEKKLATFGPAMWHYRDQPHRPTTRALNLYTGERRDFEYLNERTRLEPKDIPPSMRGARWLHCVCSPTRSLTLQQQIDDDPVWKPLLVFEPIPDRCIPEELGSLKKILPFLGVLSPNHEEAGSFFGISAEETKERGKKGIEEVAGWFFDAGAARDVVIRSGAWGAYAVRKGGKGVWVPAYHTDQRLMAGLELHPDDLALACEMGAVSASFTIEQFALPSMTTVDGVELWNGSTDASGRSPTHLADLTNSQTYGLGTATPVASSSRDLAALPSRNLFRQTSLLDVFSAPPTDSPLSTSSHTSFNFDNDDASRSSSVAPTSPCAALDCFDDSRSAGKAVVRDDSDDEMMVDEEPLEREVDEAEARVPPSKRRRMYVVPEVPEPPRLVAEVELKFGERRIPSFYNGRTQMGVHTMLQKRALGLRVGPAQVSMRPHLTDLVSGNESQIFRCHSQHPIRTFAPPFALAFSKGAKAGGKQLLAVADEEGRINLIDAGRDSLWDAAHHNAIFDVAWNHDDSAMATASGDQTVQLWDTETQACLGVLAGHTCTIKNVAWDPFNPNMLSTASRDGAIRVWDRRVPGADLPPPAGPTSASATPGSSIATVNMIKNAHGTKGKASKGRSATKSVTSVAYLPHMQHGLASSGSSDSIIKIWDLRKNQTRRVNPVFVETNDVAVASTNQLRPHGISSMVMAPNGQKIYGLSTDSKIYSFDPHNLTQAVPLTTFTHPQLSCATFYVRISVSPCSRFLASGSSDGSVLLWDTEGPGNDGVRVLGHEKETAGLDWGYDTLASCSDDHLVRAWKFDDRIARKAREDKEVRWKWSGADE
ncbi:hypothetical protein MNV49_002403 [Pseudohyphozyma bogoriensis]|nr:hypothetical protein MNV49_002403 [Pseudohyphozyma bogoriensis]